MRFRATLARPQYPVPRPIATRWHTGAIPGDSFPVNHTTEVETAAGVVVGRFVAGPTLGGAQMAFIKVDTEGLAEPLYVTNRQLPRRRFRQSNWLGTDLETLQSLVPRVQFQAADMDEPAWIESVINAADPLFAELEPWQCDACQQWPFMSPNVHGMINYGVVRVFSMADVTEFVTAPLWVDRSVTSRRRGMQWLDIVMDRGSRLHDHGDWFDGEFVSRLEYTVPRDSTYGDNGQFMRTRQTIYGGKDVYDSCPLYVRGRSASQPDLNWWEKPEDKARVERNIQAITSEEYLPFVVEPKLWNQTGRGYFAFGKTAGCPSSESFRDRVDQKVREYATPAAGGYYDYKPMSARPQPSAAGEDPDFGGVESLAIDIENPEVFNAQLLSIVCDLFARPITVVNENGTLIDQRAEGVVSWNEVPGKQQGSNMLGKDQWDPYGGKHNGWYALDDEHFTMMNVLATAAATGCPVIRHTLRSRAESIVCDAKQGIDKVVPYGQGAYRALARKLKASAHLVWLFDTEGDDTASKLRDQMAKLVAVALGPLEPATELDRPNCTKLQLIASNTKLAPDENANWPEPGSKSHRLGWEGGMSVAGLWAASRMLTGHEESVAQRAEELVEYIARQWVRYGTWQARDIDTGVYKWHVGNTIVCADQNDTKNGPPLPQEDYGDENSTWDPLKVSTYSYQRWVASCALWMVHNLQGDDAEQAQAWLDQFYPNGPNDLRDYEWFAAW